MSKESIFLSIISLSLVVVSGLFVLKIVDDTDRSILRERVELIESNVSKIERNRFTEQDHENFLRQKLAADQVTETRIVRIFDRLRGLEKKIRQISGKGNCDVVE